MAYQMDTNLFDVIDERELGDLERLVALLDLLPAEELIRTLERARRSRRNDNPVRRMWYCMVACALYGGSGTANASTSVECSQLDPLPS